MDKTDGEHSAEQNSFVRKGSIRKVLPRENVDVLVNHLEGLNQLHRMYSQEYSIMAEYKMVQSENLHGVYVIPSRQSAFVWFGVVFVRMGLYEDGIFRFKILLDERFPDCGPPVVIFEEGVIHPVIDSQTMELNLRCAFPSWDRKVHHVWQVIKYIQWVFYNFNSSLSHAVNQDLVCLYEQNFEDFNKEVRNCVQNSQEGIFNISTDSDDKHYLIFERYVPEKHERARLNLLKSTEHSTGNTGYSWVRPGTFKPLSDSPN